MAKKIAKVDNEVMNSLYGGEFARLAGKAPKVAGDDSAPQAFKDHEEYVKTLESVLKEDNKDNFDPNDTKLD